MRSQHIWAKHGKASLPAHGTFWRLSCALGLLGGVYLVSHVSSWRLKLSATAGRGGREPSALRLSEISGRSTAPPGERRPPSVFMTDFSVSGTSSTFHCSSS